MKDLKENLNKILKIYIIYNINFFKIKIKIKN